jgi:hypothetical protein
MIGAIYGAIDPPCIACGKTVGPFFGAIIGVIEFGLKFGLLAASAGFVVGAIGSCFWRQQGKLSRDPYSRPFADDQDYWSRPQSEEFKRLDR